MDTKFCDKGATATVTYERYNGAVKTVTGVIIERPIFRPESANYRIRTAKGDVWARLGGSVGTSARTMGITLNIEEN